MHGRAEGRTCGLAEDGRNATSPRDCHSGFDFSGGRMPSDVPLSFTKASFPGFRCISTYLLATVTLLSILPDSNSGSLSALAGNV